MSVPQVKIQTEYNDDKKFHELGLDDRILEAIARLGWEKPTLIQEKAIPYFLQGKDILARARTGSGKTGAFLIPLVQKILQEKANAEEQIIRALILAPSKELCKQITEHIQQLTALCKREVRCIDVSPQVPLEAQRPLLADNPDIIIGTPLKILNHMAEGNLNFKDSLQYLIIDEADLMFAFDHEHDMKAVLRKLPSIYQSFITSATVQDDVKKLKNMVLRNPIILKLEEPPLPPTTQLTQYVIKVEDFEKAILLYSLFRLNLIKGKTIVFVNTVDKGYKLRMFLGQFNIKSCILNSELPVASRCHIVDEFNRDRYKILIASDEKTIVNPSAVKPSNQKSKRKRDRESGVSRGIDFQRVANVINFEFPADVETYIHRVGRTARMTSQGTALSLVSSMELKTFGIVSKDLQEVLNIDEQHEKVFKDFKFNMASLDGFRYRANDAWKRCTTIAVKDYRRREIKQEILNSQKLKSFFEDHPKDLEVLRHDVCGRTLPSMPHLKNVPEYNIPPSLRRINLGIKKKRLNKNAPKREIPKSRAKFLKRSEDPLRSLKFSGFKDDD